MPITDNKEDFVLYNPYVEDSILKGILANSNLLQYIFSEVTEELFYLQSNKIIFQNMRVLYLKDEQITPVTLLYQLETCDVVDTIGGNTRIAQLTQTDFCLSTPELNLFFAILKDKYIKRKLIYLSSSLGQLSYNYESCEHINLDEIETTITQIKQVHSKNYFTKASNIIPGTFSDFQAQTGSIRRANLKTGFSELDYLLNGLQKGNLLILAGRPSMGKTALSLSIITNICKYRPDTCILFFSLEMSSKQIITRLMLMESGLPLDILKKFNIFEDDIARQKELFPFLFKSNLYINDDSSLQLEDIKLALKNINAKYGLLDLVIIDYLQLLGNYKDNRAQEIGYITRTLKALARKFNVPIITLSQLNRNVEQRSNKKPLLSDLRESGCISGNILVSIACSQVQKKVCEIKTPTFFCVDSFNPRSNAGVFLALKYKQFNGVKHTYSLRVHTLLEVQMTGNHQVLTLNGWKRLDNLTKWDKLAIRKPRSRKDLLFSLFTVSYSKKNSIWNFNIPPFTIFIANSILIHNSIEQDADIVLLLYRAHYYFPEEAENTSEIIIAKNRNGKTGTVFVKFYPEIVQFRS
uniref:replication helicase subunit n=1 Tax=Chroothece richteriana TaxID=101928 RepID=UPI001FCDA864|nr:replication helicase subunit [Chroothece richteriana]UNJ14231.1 replication helicase subunit [Chroothece richteriana]